MGIEENVKVTKAFNEAMELIFAVAQELPREAPTQTAYYKKVRDKLIERYPLPEKPAESNPFKPMTDEESIIFGEQLMPFGQFKGSRVDDATQNYLRYLVDDDSNSKFINQLGRYLASDRVKREK